MIRKPRPIHVQRLSAPSHTLPVGDQTFIEVTTDSEEIGRARSVTTQELFCYYPERLYISANPDAMDDLDPDGEPDTDPAMRVLPAIERVSAAALHVILQTKALFLSSGRL
jgi:broad specificity phosphatase PhoE